METTLHYIHELRFEGNNMILKVDNRVIKLHLAEVSDKLLKASETERKNFQISPSGYGIHWHQLDEDLSLKGLLKQASTHSI